MSSICGFVDSEFLSKSTCLRTLGEGTFGTVALYNTPKGQFVIKETKLDHKSPGYPPDLITEADLMIKLRPLSTVVTFEGICFDLTRKKGYILMEELDSNLSQWSREVDFSTRIQYLPDIITMIGGTLAVLRYFKLCHNDMKTNNILVGKSASNKYIFKLADFGKAIRVIDKNVPYGGIDKYKPPMHRDVYSSEYWAFMVCLVEVIIGGRRMVSDDCMVHFYKERLKRDKFDLKGYLSRELTTLEFRAIPNIFWKFVQPIIDSTTSMSEVEIDVGLEAIDAELSDTMIETIDKTISKSTDIHPRFEKHKREIKRNFRRLDKEKYYVPFKKLFNKFLHLAPEITEEAVMYYAEVAYIIIIRGKVDGYIYFDSLKTFLWFERAFLARVGYQIHVL